MIQKNIDLYEQFGIPKDEDVRGELICQVLTPNLSVSENRRRPAVLILPGGGYSRTSQREGEPIALHFLLRNYAAFTLHYTCAPHSFPVALREAAMAMRYIRENADDFDVEPSMVAAVGFSAGGHLCGMLGTMYDCAEVADLDDADMIRPNALALCYPVLIEEGRTHQGSFECISGGNTALRKRLSIEKHVRPDMPPVFLWHTRTDNCVPCRNSIIMAQALEEAGVDFSLHIYHKGPHGLSTADDLTYPSWGMPEISQDVKKWISEMLDFFADVGFCTVDASR